MESSYGIGVKNRYELFYDDEEDPTELLRQQEEEKERRKAEKSTAKDKIGKGPAGAPVKGVKTPVNAAGKKQAKEAPVSKSQERTIAPRDDNKLQRTTRPDRAVKFAPPSGGRENQQDFEERKNRRNREERISTGGSGPDGRFEYGSRDRGDGEIRRGGRGGGGLGGRGGFPRRGRGGFAPEGGRGGGFGGRGGYDGRGKREFERQSGSDRSGVKPVDKKGGEGSYNWGTVNDDLEVQLSPFGDENTTEAAEKSGDETAAGENAADTRMKTNTCVVVGSARWSTLRSTLLTSGVAVVVAEAGAWVGEVPAEAASAGPADHLVKAVSGQHEVDTTVAEVALAEAVPRVPGVSRPSSRHPRWTTGTTSRRSWPPEAQPASCVPPLLRAAFFRRQEPSGDSVQEAMARRSCFACGYTIDFPGPLSPPPPFRLVFQVCAVRQIPPLSLLS
ncbi:plasminogen activator inhibitor 1 RNA-binding protein isoform X2 [Dermacentor silvarum]|uniref:plasminogen activator inhibitor 1 RNA-binding protein isoform X2 n=1 Tax=Dermacentor silvarum TaxID=543639 RepID=UPI0021006DD5|nr:plasminogen activator inhibitor 1 RNA-binding protein isoform X2 [Dermacentor silvarum]